MLNQYLQDLQGFLRDRDEGKLNPDDLRGYINRARREIAGRTQCCRVLSPICGAVQSITVTAPGTGYTNPTVKISSPDSPRGSGEFPGGQQATAVVNEIAGSIVNILVTGGGDGYFQPGITIEDPTGHGAAATANISPISQTQYAREVYLFKDIAQIIDAQNPGIGDIFAVKSVSFIYANYRYSLPCYPFSVYQSQVRQYPQQYLYIPTICAQFGQGVNGSIYMYPIPSTAYQFEFDCFCHPIELIDDQTYEAVPQPWQDAVAMGAAVYAYEELQNLNAAMYWQRKFDTYVGRYSTIARPGRMVSPYGRF